MNPKYLKIFGIAAVVVLILAGIFFFKNNPSSPEPVAANGPISGTITFTALKPDPEDADKGTLTIKYKKYNSSDTYQATGLKLPVENNVKWTWDSAVSGETYDIIAVLTIGDKEIKQSESTTVTAPAENIVLPLHVDWDDLPADLIEKATTAVKGTAIINGFIPQGSVLTISAKEASSQNFVTTQTFNNPTSSQSWVWQNAVRGTDYNVKADLTQNGVLIGTTGSLNAIAGDNAVTLILTSRATPPQPTTTTISGNVFINGPLNNNSTVIITAQQSGTGATTQISQINNPSNNSQNWQWNGAQTGTSYQIVATLQVNGSTTAQARSATVTAPATNVNFTINTGVNIQTPSANPSLQSCTQTGGNNYNATLRWPNQSNAGNYWFQVGSTSHQSDVLNQKVSANNNQNPTTTVQITGSRNYFAQWAYSLCTNCSGDQNFSNFSNPMQFYCGNNPNPSPTPVPSPSPSPSPSPTPSPTPKISQCGQTCNSNGYSCAQGLTCLSRPGGAIGSQTCQNQACPGEPDCICPLQ